MKIYYATVVQSDGHGWSNVGEVRIEPLRVEASKPLGKEPEMCCSEMKEAYFKEEALVHASYTVTGKHPKMYLTQDLSRKPIRFCPFCAAHIEFEEHLKVRCIAIPRTIHDLRYEVVREEE